MNSVTRLDAIRLQAKCQICLHTQLNTVPPVYPDYKEETGHVLLYAH